MNETPRQAQQRIPGFAVQYRFALSPIPGNPPDMVSLPPDPIPASRRLGHSRNAALPRIFYLLVIAQLLVILVGVALTGSLEQIIEQQHSHLIYHHFLFDGTAADLRGYFAGNRGLWWSVLPLGWAIAAVIDARIQAITNGKMVFRFELVGWLLLCGLLFGFVCSALSECTLIAP